MKAKLDAFLAWWLGELASLLPWLKTSDPAIAIWQEGRIVNEAALPKGHPVILRLPEAKPWRRTFDLPRNARRYLRQIVAGEMDRRTPWRADQVYFHVAPDPAPAEPGRMMVALTVLPRTAAAPALEAFARLGLTAQSISLADGAEAPLAGGAGRSFAAGRRAVPALAALLALATLSVAVQSVWLGLAEARLATARQDVKKVRSLAAEVEHLRRQRDLPHLKRQETPSALGTLDTLARAVPDDSWAESVTIRNDRLVMTGLSADATKLLPLVGAAFPDAKFDAPVTSVKGGQAFALSARSTGPGAR